MFTGSMSDHAGIIRSPRAANQCSANSRRRLSRINRLKALSGIVRVPGPPFLIAPVHCRVQARTGSSYAELTTHSTIIAVVPIYDTTSGRVSGYETRHHQRSRLRQVNG